MAGFKALDALFDDSISLPYKGKVYVVPSPPAEDGLKAEKISMLAARMMAGGEAPNQAVLDDDEEVDLYRLCLGPVYDELLADRVSSAAIKHFGITAMLWVTQDQETAERYWGSGGDPSLLAPNRAARRAKSSSSAGAAASATRSRGSTSGTKTPRARKQAASKV
jgi:hypothetical protein